MRSIRSFLLLSLLLTTVAITSIAVIANLALGHKTLQSQLDTHLALITCTIETLMDKEPLSSRAKQTPKAFKNKIEAALHATHLPKNENHQIKYIKLLLDNLVIQIWDHQQRPLLNLPQASYLTLQPKQLGYSDKIDKNHKTWRVLTTYDPTHKVYICLAQRHKIRSQLEMETLKTAIGILLLIYPFFGLIIWIIVGRSLSSLSRITKRLAHCKHHDLKPLATKHVPVEVQPLIKALNQMLRRLTESFEREKRFAANAAHELRTPIASVSAQIQVALNDATTKEQHTAAIQKALKGVERSTHLIEQLLILGGLAPETNINKPVLVNLTQQCGETLANLVPEAMKKNTTIELIASKEEEPIYIWGYSRLLSILLRNLIDNAIRYTPENSLIQVFIEQAPDESVILKVIDNGPGIPEELRERVFERFFRVLGIKAKGSGLGMSIIQQITELHHATIELLTPPSGKGLEVRIHFPSPDIS